jgi:hypothetical protein
MPSRRSRERGNPGTFARSTKARFFAIPDRAAVARCGFGRAARRAASGPGWGRGGESAARAGRAAEPPSPVEAGRRSARIDAQRPPCAAPVPALPPNVALFLPLRVVRSARPACRGAGKDGEFAARSETSKSFTRQFSDRYNCQVRSDVRYEKRKDTRRSARPCRTGSGRQGTADVPRLARQHGGSARLDPSATSARSCRTAAVDCAPVAGIKRENCECWPITCRTCFS